MKTKATALLLAIVLVVSSLTGCGLLTEQLGNLTEQMGNLTGQSESTKNLTLSPEATSATTDDGITVDVGD